LSGSRINGTKKKQARPSGAAAGSEPNRFASRPAKDFAVRTPCRVRRTELEVVLLSGLALTREEWTDGWWMVDGD
jgi:hypothetical protein